MQEAKINSSQVTKPKTVVEEQTRVCSLREHQKMLSTLLPTLLHATVGTCLPISFSSCWSCIPPLSTPNRWTDYVGSRWYRSPEMLAGSTDYGRPADVWACACLAVEMRSGRPLFPGEDEGQLVSDFGFDFITHHLFICFVFTFFIEMGLGEIPSRTNSIKPVLKKSIASLDRHRIRFPPDR